MSGSASPGLNLAKCAVTALAVWLADLGEKEGTGRRGSWSSHGCRPCSFWRDGCISVPRRLTLLYLAAFLAILFRIDERPWLAFLLPIVQVAWVNSQGLFILGPVVLAFALIDAATRPGAFDTDRRRWWRTVLIAAGLTGLVCLVNPYGIAGALYPLQLAATMGNPIFETIGELDPLLSFARKAGLANVPLLIHLSTIFLGVLSFLVPIGWRVFHRMAREPDVAAPPPKKRKRSKKNAGPTEPGFARPSVFRLLLFMAFTALSFKATRNSHQFAAVVGTITAWNFAEWAAEVARSRASRGRPITMGIGRGLAFVATATLFVATATGALYAWEGEGRTVGLGEERHWFPHAAVAIAGRPDMPQRSVCFHNGHAALYEYKYAPDRKTYADARLEVIGPELFKAYTDLQGKIAHNAVDGRTSSSGWAGRSCSPTTSRP